ncbi:metallophosphoesterase [Lysobacter silvisoli]|uniref:Calcineurin-like phosphoesterase domain-containing protein n=1 Tax=Lysobacter silvisoli TaxID=2293254 RepID=A0A371K0R9_9GAMM|nr:metallophosphoesterase [Lysobacter silvisoli]RDZ27531.1 hypothetical protein DX914_15025 [Lysobacter silvisoli]
MRRAAKWLTCALLLALATVAGLVVFGGWKLKDGSGNVALGWDADAQRLQWMQRPALDQDGPHVFVDGSGYRVVATRRDGAQWRVHERRLPLQPAPTLTVEVGDPVRTRFEVTLRPTPAAEDGDTPAQPARLLVLSDMEGEFDRYTALLRAQGVVDEKLHWRYGDGHIALVGDFVDRGRDMLPLLWLIYRLDDEARRAGGRVHYVLGNHEQLGLSGRMKYWPRHLVATQAALGEQALFGERSVLGAWLRSKPVIARVGDTLLVHGGISAAFLDRDLDVAAANAVARPHYGTPLDEMPEAAAAVLGRSGVTWYRGMALPDDPKYARDADPSAHLDRALQRYGVRRIAIGHTIVPNVRLQQNGRVLALDLDMHAPDAVAQAALYEDGRWWRVDANGARAPLR